MQKNRQFGVDDPRENCKIVGLTENTPNRKNEADLNDFLNSKTFAGGNIPTVNVRTLKIDNKEIDVIRIKNNIKKPFYLEKDYGKVKAYHIYTRTGDRNTPKNENANFVDIEYMWKEHFGLHLDVDERFKLYLEDIENWKDEFDTKETALYKPNPNFSIELTEGEHSEYVEPFNTFYLNNSLIWGDVLFKYNSQVIFKCLYAYCDEVRVLISEPKLHTLKYDNYEEIHFYYYNLEEIEGLFAELISKSTFDFISRIRSFPFIIVKDEKMLNEFIEYLTDNINPTDISSDTKFNKEEPNKYTSPVNLESLVYIESVFYKWKIDYEVS